MTPEDERLLVERQTDKALHFLNQADEMLSLSHSDLAVNRYYYACFHIVQALFIQRKINGHTHSGVITQFSKHFVKSGLATMEEGSLLARLFQLRQKADYNCAYSVSAEEAESLSAPVHKFIDSMVRIINDYKSES